MKHSFNEWVRETVKERKKGKMSLFSSNINYTENSSDVSDSMFCTFQKFLASLALFV